MFDIILNYREKIIVSNFNKNISKLLNPLPWHQIHASTSLKTGHFKAKH